MRVKTRESELNQRVSRLRKLISIPTSGSVHPGHADFRRACDDAERILTRASATLQEASRVDADDISALAAVVTRLDDTIEQLVSARSTLDAASRLAHSLPHEASESDRVGLLNSKCRDLLCQARDQCKIARRRLLTCRGIEDKCNDWLEFILRVEQSLNEPLAGNCEALVAQKQAVSVSSFSAMNLTLH